MRNESTPTNTVLGTTYSYVGQHQKLTESNFALQYTQMGARIYVPSIGRFLQVDLVEGGVDNNYVYPTDPVNDFDLTGEWSWRSAKKWTSNAWRSTKRAPSKTYNYYKNFYSNPNNVINAVAMARGGRSIRSYKSPRYSQNIGGKYTRITWTVNARNVGGAARAVYTKIKDMNGQTIRMYKDTYSVNNRLLHRKIKL